MKKTLALTIIALSTSCASIIDGTSQNIRLDSDPAGAKVVINNYNAGKTPITLKANRDKDFVGRVKKKGYEDNSFIITRKFNKNSLWNTVILPFYLIDWMTGSIWEFEKDKALLELDKNDSNDAKGDNKIHNEFKPVINNNLQIPLSKGDINRLNGLYNRPSNLKNYNIVRTTKGNKYITDWRKNKWIKWDKIGMLGIAGRNKPLTDEQYEEYNRDWKFNVEGYIVDKNTKWGRCFDTRKKRWLERKPRKSAKKFRWLCLKEDREYNGLDESFAYLKNR